MTVLITGGGGFLGGWVVRRLFAQGIDLRVFDRASDRRLVREIAGSDADNIDWRTGDVSNPDHVMESAEGCSFIIHLAGLLTPDCANNPILGAQVNLLGTLNVFEAAKSQNMKGVAYASSGGIFGSSDGATPYPMTQYGAFKLACEGSARAYWTDAGMPSIWFRPTIIYGPGRETGLTAGPTLACREAVAGRAYTIGYSGKQDLIYVDDAAAAFVAAALNTFDGAHAFSLIGATEDVPDIIAAIKSHVPEAEIDFAGDEVPMAAVITPTPFEHILGPQPRIPLTTGIAQTIAHYKNLS